MARPVHAYPCGYCGTRVIPGNDTCPTCGIRLIDITRRNWGYEARDVVFEALDKAKENAKAALRRPGSRQTAGAVAASALLGALLVGIALRRNGKA